MKILIPCKFEYDDSFIKWLIVIIRDQIILNFRSDKLDLISEYIKDTTDYDINLYDVFIKILENITYFKTNYYYHITIDQSIKIKNTPFKLIDIAKLINYGNCDIEGIFIFSKVFYDIHKRIDAYFSKYRLEVGTL